MPIDVSPKLEAALLARAQAAGISLELYLERIAASDAAAEAELLSAALDGLNSGDSRPGDATFWAERYSRLNRP